MHQISPESVRDVMNLYTLLIHPKLLNYTDGVEVILLLDIAPMRDTILSTAAEIGITWEGKPVTLEIVRAMYEGVGFQDDGTGAWVHPNHDWKNQWLGDLFVEHISLTGKMGWSKDYIIIPQHPDLRDNLVRIASDLGVCDTIDEIIVYIAAAGFKKDYTTTDGTSFSR